MIELNHSAVKKGVTNVNKGLTRRLEDQIRRYHVRFHVSHDRQDFECKLV